MVLLLQWIQTQMMVMLNETFSRLLIQSLIGPSFLVIRKSLEPGILRDYGSTNSFSLAEVI
jgi:hypothetical protein